MFSTDPKTSLDTKIDPIDDYLECVTYCSVENFEKGEDCQIICMERYLQGNYFWNFKVILKIFIRSAIVFASVSFKILLQEQNEFIIHEKLIFSN